MHKLFIASLLLLTAIVHLFSSSHAKASGILAQDLAKPLTPVTITSTDGAIAVVEGRHHACMLRRTGGVQCWGGGTLDLSTLLGNGGNFESYIPVDVVGLTSGVKKIVAGILHTCALTVEGAVKCWGTNEFGQLGNGTLINNGIAGTVSGLTSGVVDIAAHAQGNCAKMASGAIQCWGSSTGDGTFEIRTIPVEISEVQNASQLDGGGWAMCAVVNRSVKCWGANGYGVLGDGTTVKRAAPTDVIGLSGNVTQIATADFFTCALDNGGVKCWGYNGFGHLGADTTAEFSATPLSVIGLESNVVKISTRAEHACALTIANDIYCWGANYAGQAGDGSFNNFKAKPVKMMDLFSNVTELTTLHTATCVRNDESDIQCLGVIASGRLGTIAKEPEVPVSVAALAKDNIHLSVGGAYNCAVTKNNAALCWGNNPYIGYEIGGKLESYLLPKEIVGLENDVQSTATGVYHSCALLKNGFVKCWRVNRSGQLGNGTRNNSSEAITATGTLSNVVQVTVGDTHSCALTASGGVQCWGDGYLIGDGIGQMSVKPVTVTGLISNVVQIDAGTAWSCAVLKTGGVKCWGLTRTLGNGVPNENDPSPLTPKEVINLEAPVKQVSVGNRHACVLLNNGKVKCWGGGSGLLGDGSDELEQYSPVPVIGLDDDIVQISAGRSHTCALNSRGAVRCWGVWMASGLGGSSIDSKTDVTGLTNVVQIAVGDTHTCALLADGAITCWGYRLALGSMPVYPVWDNNILLTSKVFLPAIVR